MKITRLLPALLLFLAALLAAQQESPNSHQARQAFLDRLEKMSVAELNQITTRAQAGDASAASTTNELLRQPDLFHQLREPRIGM